MAVGQQATQQTVNNTLTSLAVQMRNLCTTIRQQDEFISALGTAGLQALGFSSADASSIITNFGFLNQVAALYFGTATQASASDFDAALAPVWAGQ